MAPTGIRSRSRRLSARVYQGQTWTPGHRLAPGHAGAVLHSVPLSQVDVVWPIVLGRSVDMAWKACHVVTNDGRGAA